MLKIEDLTEEVNGKILLHDVNLEVKKGYTNVLFGPNGAGKSALMRTIMGFSEYRVIKGRILFNGKDITDDLFITPPQGDGNYALFEKDNFAAYIKKENHFINTTLAKENLIKENLIKNKKASGRYKDLDDVEKLSPAQGKNQ